MRKVSLVTFYVLRITACQPPEFPKSQIFIRLLMRCLLYVDVVNEAIVAQNGRFWQADQVYLGRATKR